MNQQVFTQVRDLNDSDDPTMLNHLDVDQLNELEQTLFMLLQKVEDEREQRDVEPVVEAHVRELIAYLFEYPDVVFYVLREDEEVQMYQYDPTAGYMERAPTDPTWQLIMHDDLVDKLELMYTTLLGGEESYQVVAEKVYRG